MKRTSDLKAAYSELGEMGKHGWYAHELQRGRVLALEVLRWLEEDGYKISKNNRDQITKPNKSSKAFDTMDAVYAAHRAIKEALKLK